MDKNEHAYEQATSIALHAHGQPVRRSRPGRPHDARASIARSLLLECERRNHRPADGADNALLRVGYDDSVLYTAASTWDVAFVEELLERELLLVFSKDGYGVCSTRQRGEGALTCSRCWSTMPCRRVFDELPGRRRWLWARLCVPAGDGEPGRSSHGERQERGDAEEGRSGPPACPWIHRAACHCWERPTGGLQGLGALAGRRALPARA
ncbi:unnamed protein product [Urochloa humidicola]